MTETSALGTRDLAEHITQVFRATDEARTVVAEP
ncbi:hypothetical protein FOHLNKBM_4021 [Methylobacterium longum]|nr:hypothetical protein FOHLNKBM_4021 [Methylobacterium longum]